MTAPRSIEPSRPDQRSHTIREFAATFAIWCAALLVMSILAWILIDIALRGMSQIDSSFLVDDVTNAGRSGGIGPVILSTTLILLVTLLVSVPLSLATAIALTEQVGYDSPLASYVRRCLDVLAGVPSIVFGLFGNAFFTITLGLGYSILSGGLTLSCMILPILIRTAEQAINSVPIEHRHAAAALGLTRTTTLFRVIIPAAAPALAAGVVLSVGRALAETAALIFTSGYVARSPESLLDSGRALSVHIYDLAMNVPNGGARAYASACVLVGMLLLINGTTALLLKAAGLGTLPQSGGRQ